MEKKKSKITPSRLRNKAAYEKQIIYEILDEALFCTISYAEADQPYSIPQSVVRIEDYIYVHGSVGSHFIRTLADGRPVCISIMLADELVIAKTAFSHSVNYRSVVIFAKGEIVEDYDFKYLTFKQLTEKMVPESWHYLKPMTQSEMDKTIAIRFSLAEASAKSRQGWPSHEENEMEFPIWTGLIPIKPIRLAPIPDEHGAKIPLPPHLMGL